MKKEQELNRHEERSLNAVRRRALSHTHKQIELSDHAEVKKQDIFHAEKPVEVEKKAKTSVFGGLARFRDEISAKFQNIKTEKERKKRKKEEEKSLALEAATENRDVLKEIESFIPSYGNSA